MQAPAGSISLSSRSNLVDLDNAPLDVVVSDSVALSARVSSRMERSGMATAAA
jgi:hypothetical protein